MALNPEDPYYRAEETPDSIRALGAGLCLAYRRPAAAFGAKGNKVHLYGYHRSRRWILNSPDSHYGDRDYSVIRVVDQGGDADWVSAFDFTPGEWGTKQNRTLMIEITTRVYEAAQRRDPRLRALREFAGTIDGKTVITFNCADGSLKDPFDTSHLDHCHGSLWRSLAAADHGGILAVMLGKDRFDMLNNDLAQVWLALMEGVSYPNGYLADDTKVEPGVRQQIKQFGGTTLNSILTKLKAVEEDVETLKAGGVSQTALVAAFKEAIKDPEIRAVFVATAFEGSQQAERQ